MNFCRFLRSAWDCFRSASGFAATGGGAGKVMRENRRCDVRSGREPATLFQVLLAPLTRNIDPRHATNCSTFLLYQRLELRLRLLPLFVFPQYVPHEMHKDGVTRLWSRGLRFHACVRSDQLVVIWIVGLIRHSDLLGVEQCLKQIRIVTDESDVVDGEALAVGHDMVAEFFKEGQRRKLGLLAWCLWLSVILLVPTSSDHVNGRIYSADEIGI